MSVNAKSFGTSSKIAKAAFVAAGSMLLTSSALAQTTYTWNNAATRQWLVPADWNLNNGLFPGVAGVSSTNADVGLFSTVTPSTNAIGINSTLLTGGQLSVGAIVNDLTSTGSAFVVGNSATVAGSVLVTRLNGATVDPGTGPINNMLLSISNNAQRDMTLQSTAAGGTGTGTTQRLEFGNSGNIYVNSGRVLTLNVILNQSAPGLTVTKLGGGVLATQVGTAGNFTGNLDAKEGILRIIGSNSIGSAKIVMSGASIENGSVNTVLSLTTTDNPIDIEANTTYSGAFQRSINFNDSLVTLGTSAGTSRTITVSNADAFMQLGRIVNGTTANSIIKEGPGGLILGGANGGSTFTGGVTINDGYLVATQVATFAGNQVTGGAVGTGGLTINGNGNVRILGSSDIAASLIDVNADFIVGGPSTIQVQNAGQNGRLTMSGPMDLGGVTRTITLASGRTSAQALTGSSPGPGLRFLPLGSVNAGTNTAVPQVLNGNLRLVGDATLPAGQYGSVAFGQFMNFDNNAGLIIGDRVITQFNTSFAFNNNDITKLPAVTVEAGGILNTSETTAVRSVTMYSLTGSGTVTSLANNASPVTATITVRNGGNSTFSGLIADGADVAPGLGLTSNTIVRFTMNGTGNQTLSGANTYTGPTSLNDGTLTTTTLTNLGVASGIGKGTSVTDSIVLFGGTLAYQSASDATTDRLFTLSTRSGGLAVNGTGTANFGNTASIGILDAADRLADLTDGSAQITNIVVGNVDLVVGMTVVGPGIPAGAKIVSIDTISNVANAITLDQPVSGSTLGGTISFLDQDRTLSLGGTNTGDNTLAAAIPDSTKGKVSVNKIGAGSWSLTGNLTYSGATSVNGGTLSIDSPLTTSSSLSVADGAAAIMEAGGTNLLATGSISLGTTGTLSTNDNDLIVDYTGTSPLADLSAYLLAGQLIPAADFGGVSTTLVLFEAADFGITEFSGIAVDSDAVLGKYTYTGDANLDGQVDAFDYSVVDDNFGSSGSFVTGDLNGDGIIDAFDYSAIDDTFGAGVGSPLRPSANTEVFIPEPSGLGVLVVGAGLLSRRRRA